MFARVFGRSDRAVMFVLADCSGVNLWGDKNDNSPEGVSSNGKISFDLGEYVSLLLLFGLLNGQNDYADN
jgi:hypothetical protein